MSRAATAEERRYDLLRRMLDRHLQDVIPRAGPRELVDGCRYVLSTGGKRIRSTLLLLACGAVGGNPRRALNAGAAIEIMHNFTLVHDDIMDGAPSRRGRPTVHVRWDLNNALLVGDVLLGYAYELLLRTRSEALHRLARLFTSGLLTVCKGQAMDLEFERMPEVTVADYFRMIEMKTGRLISLSAEMGGIIGGGTSRQVTALISFGHYLGRAFQLQDDLLDVTGSATRFGKAIGGDIIARKKTYMLLTAAERAGGADRRLIRRLLLPDHRRRSATKLRVAPSERMLVRRVTEIYRRYGVIDDAAALVRRNTLRAVASLGALPDNGATAALRWLAQYLLQRVS